MATRASNERPTKRVLRSGWGELIVELREDTILIRPLRTRAGGRAEVMVRVGSIYQRAVEQKLAEEKREKKKARKRGRKA